MTRGISIDVEDLAMNITLDDDDLDQQKVNDHTMSTAIYSSVVISAFFIIGVNFTIIKSIMAEKNFTFINILVLLDCLDSIAHIPILLQFFL